MRMTRTLLITAQLALLSLVPPASTAHARKRKSRPARVLIARWSAHENRHGIGHRVATDTGIEASVRLTFLAAGRVALVDAGLRRHSMMSEGGYSSDRTSWSNQWTGKRRRRGKTLHLSLRLAKHRCQRVLGRRWRGETHVKETTKACAKPASTLTLACEQATVQAAPAHDAKPGAKSTQQPIWRCYPTDSAKTHGSRAPWVFGQRHCLESYWVRRLRYRICARKKVP